MKRFNLDKMDDASRIVIVGKRTSGRTTLIKDILQHFKHISAGLVVSRVEHLEQKYKDVVPADCIRYELDGVSEEVLERQAQAKNQSSITQHSIVDPRFFLVLDDVMFANGWQDDTSMQEVLWNGAKHDILRILSLGYFLGLSKTIRDKIDWIFIFREEVNGNLKRLYDSCCGFFPNQHVFDSVLSQVAKGYTCLVVDNRQDGQCIERAFWYQAPSPGDTSW